MQANTVKGFLYVMLAVCIWSGWIVVSRFAVQSHMTPYDVAALRFFFCGLIFLPVVLKKGLRVGPYGLLSSLILAFLIGVPYTCIALAGMKYAPASHASTVINAAMLILTTTASIHGLKEPTSRIRLLGVMASLLGVAFILCARSDNALANQWLGHLLFVISGLMWGGYTVLTRAWRVNVLHASAVVCVISLLVYIPLYLTFVDHPVYEQPWKAVVFQSFYQGVLTGVVAFIAFYSGVAILGAARASAMVPLVPVLATIIAIPVLDEVPSLLEWAGVASVSIGVLLASGAMDIRKLMLKQGR